MLVAFSCKQRELCPSCAAKRGSELAAFLADHVLCDVGHAQWVFTIPKMLRPLFFRRRELRGVLARLAWQSVGELMAAAACEPELRPGMISVIQTFGDRINPHPHVHALVSRGGWTRDDRFVPIPYVDPTAAEKLFRHKVFAFLLREELISLERVELLSSWRHSGFSVHNAVHVAPGDHGAVEALVRYSNAARGKRRRDDAVGTDTDTLQQQSAPTPAAVAVRKRWADLLRRVYEVDPLVCPRCSARMRVVGFITRRQTIERILDHLRRRSTSRPRSPPAPAASIHASSA